MMHAKQSVACTKAAWNCACPRTIKGKEIGFPASYQAFLLRECSTVLLCEKGSRGLPAATDQPCVCCSCESHRGSGCQLVLTPRPVASSVFCPSGMAGEGSNSASAVSKHCLTARSSAHNLGLAMHDSAGNSWSIIYATRLIILCRR